MVSKLTKLDNRGVTLIELIVGMTISAILFTLVASMFFTGSKIYRDIYNSIEIQQQGHFVMDFMTTRIMPSSKIDNIKDIDNNSCYKIDQVIELGEIKLIDTCLKEEERHIFSIQNDPKVEGQSIRYGKIDVAKIEAGNYINKIHIKPLPEGSTYEQARGIEITIEMKKGDSNLKISKNIYFRK